MRTPNVLILFVTLLSGTVVHGAALGPSPLDPGTAPVTAENVRLEPCEMTQNDVPDTVAPGSVACSGGGIATDNWFGRVYDLAFYGVEGQYCVTRLDYALESVSAPTPTTYQVSCVPDGTAGNPGGFVSVADLDAGEVFSVNVIDGPADLEFFSVELGGCCVGETHDLAVFAITADCQEVGCGGYWPGSNSLGQSSAAYLGAPDCGIVDPIETGLIGFPDMHLLQVVDGEGPPGCGDENDGPEDDPGDVPANGTIGSLLIVLLVLGSSAYFLGRS